ncbi:unnamed protein product [Prorocentrum cordatum]|uniref:Uncharacterized protein n=1 Tax=Prorocentrum cordatum TaxID=2364126 RepID=A0ABN9WMZ5_9DINO|nr:unnamed protein product [Polarella glacialis]
MAGSCASSPTFSADFVPMMSLLMAPCLILRSPFAALMMLLCLSVPLCMFNTAIYLKFAAILVEVSPTLPLESCMPSPLTPPAWVVLDHFRHGTALDPFHHFMRNLPLVMISLVALPPILALAFIALLFSFMGNLPLVMTSLVALFHFTQLLLRVTALFQLPPQAPCLWAACRLRSTTPRRSSGRRG